MTVLVVREYNANLGKEGTVRFRDRAEEAGGLPTFSRLASSSKGVADILGTFSKTGQLLSRALPQASVWTSHVSAVAGQARTALAIPYMLTLVNNLTKAVNQKDYLNVTRNSLELGSTGAFAASLMVTDKATASLLGGVGSTVKTVVDGVDLGVAVDKTVKYNNQRLQADKLNASEEVKSGIKSQLTASALRVARFALAMFAGVLSVLSFVFKVVISKELLIAGVVASLGSIVLSLAAGLTAEGARYVPITKEFSTIAVHRPSQM